MHIQQQQMIAALYGDAGLADKLRGYNQSNIREAWPSIVDKVASDMLLSNDAMASLMAVIRTTAIVEDWLEELLLGVNQWAIKAYGNTDAADDQAFKAALQQGLRLLGVKAPAVYPFTPEGAPKPQFHRRHSTYSVASQLFGNVDELELQDSGYTTRESSNVSPTVASKLLQQAPWPEGIELKGEDWDKLCALDAFMFGEQGFSRQLDGILSPADKRAPKLPPHFYQNYVLALFGGPLFQDTANHRDSVFNNSINSFKAGIAKNVSDFFTKERLDSIKIWSAAKQWDENLQKHVQTVAWERLKRDEFKNKLLKKLCEELVNFISAPYLREMRRASLNIKRNSTVFPASPQVPSSHENGDQVDTDSTELSFQAHIDIKPQATPINAYFVQMATLIDQYYERLLQNGYRAYQQADMQALIDDMSAVVAHIATLGTAESPIQTRIMKPRILADFAGLFTDSNPMSMAQGLQHFMKGLAEGYLKEGELQAKDYIKQRQQQYELWQQQMANTWGDSQAQKLIQADAWRHYFDMVQHFLLAQDGLLTTVRSAMTQGEVVNWRHYIDEKLESPHTLESSLEDIESFDRVKMLLIKYAKTGWQHKDLLAATEQLQHDLLEVFARHTEILPDRAKTAIQAARQWCQDHPPAERPPVSPVLAQGHDHVVSSVHEVEYLEEKRVAAAFEKTAGWVLAVQRWKWRSGLSQDARAMEAELKDSMVGKISRVTITDNAAVMLKTETATVTSKARPEKAGEESVVDVSAAMHVSFEGVSDKKAQVEAACLALAKISALAFYTSRAKSCVEGADPFAKTLDIKPQSRDGKRISATDRLYAKCLAEALTKLGFKVHLHNTKVPRIPASCHSDAMHSEDFHEHTQAPVAMRHVTLPEDPAHLRDE